MDEEFGMPPGSEIRGGKVGSRVIFRWPAPANWLERVGPDRLFWIGVGICGPGAAALFFVEPIYAVACLFVILFWAGACGGRWRPSGFEEVAMDNEAMDIRRGTSRGGTIPPLSEPARCHVARVGRQKLQMPRLDDTPRGRRLILSSDKATFALGAGLGREDLSRLHLFIREWLQV